jgi:hypothetical protein
MESQVIEARIIEAAGSDLAGIDLAGIDLAVIDYAPGLRAGELPLRFSTFILNIHRQFLC